MYDTNRLAAILVLSNEAMLNTAFSSSSVAKLSVFDETYVHANNKFIILVHAHCSILGLRAGAGERLAGAESERSY